MNFADYLRDVANQSGAINEQLEIARMKLVGLIIDKCTTAAINGEYSTDIEIKDHDLTMVFASPWFIELVDKLGLRFIPENTHMSLSSTSTFFTLYWK
jgi:hypothetical protein